MGKATRQDGAAQLLLRRAERIEELESFIGIIYETLSRQQEAGECISDEVDQILVQIKEVIVKGRPRLKATLIDRQSRTIDDLASAMRESVRMLDAAPRPIECFGREDALALTASMTVVKVALEETLAQHNLAAGPAAQRNTFTPKTALEAANARKDR